MINLNQVPVQRAHAIIPAGDPGLEILDGGATYTGPCPACQKEITVDRNTALCDACGVELSAYIVHPRRGGSYMRLSF